MSVAPELNRHAGEAVIAAKPPFLRRVRIRGYKSIAFCDVSLEPLTILVGRNASGKSNFLDALGFLRDVMEMRVGEAVDQRHGWRAIHCRTGPTPHIEIGISASFDSYKSRWDAEYEFRLELAERNQVRVNREYLRMIEVDDGRECGFAFEDGQFEWIGREMFGNSMFADGKFPPPHFFRQRRSDRLALSVIGTPPFLSLWERLSAAGTYNFSPPAMRVLQPITASPILTRDGSNVARAIEGLRELEPETIVRIGQYLKAIVPGIAEFWTQEYGDYETVRFRFQSEPPRAIQEFDASGMSDGSLRILAALVAAFQVTLPMGLPGFVGIEEPETALHPAAMRALVAALDEATLRTQILLTTHSPDLLDAPPVKPANVRVVQMVNGHTGIGPVDEASVEIVARDLSSLGGLERENQMTPDLDDQDRQRLLARGPAA